MLAVVRLVSVPRPGATRGRQTRAGPRRRRTRTGGAAARHPARVSTSSVALPSAAVRPSTCQRGVHGRIESHNASHTCTPLHARTAAADQPHARGAAPVRRHRTAPEYAQPAFGFNCNTGHDNDDWVVPYVARWCPVVCERAAALWARRAAAASVFTAAHVDVDV